MKTLRNIIFDLGGIFIEINFLKTEQAFAALGVANWSDLYTQHTASTLFEDLETGKCSPDQFYDRFRQATGLSISNEQIRDAWNAMLGKFPPERVHWLRDIAKRYNVYLYSNTNLIHYEAFQQIFRDCTGLKNFDDHFIKAHYSHELGLRKPYPASFTHLLQLENLDAAETLFIDDTPKNIEGAKQAGLQTILLTPPMTVFDLDLQ